MIDISNVRIEECETHLFISVFDRLEVQWLLEQVASKDDFEFYPRHKVLQNKVPALSMLSEEERNAEIDRFYGEEMGDIIKKVPEAIISHFNAEDLFQVLKPILIDEEHDADYEKYRKEEQEKFEKEFQKNRREEQFRKNIKTKFCEVRYNKIYAIVRRDHSGLYNNWLDAYKQIRGYQDVMIDSFPYDDVLKDEDEYVSGSYACALRLANDFVFECELNLEEEE